MTSGSTYLTTDGLRVLEEELDQLRSVRRLEIAQRIQEAKDMGELEWVYNAEYEEAKSERGFVEGRIQELEVMIHSAVIIPDHSRARLKSGIVEVGSIVKVQFLATKKNGAFTIVGSTESSPTDGKISNESPLGVALMGKSAGSEVDFTVPAGTQRVKIVSVR